jgi:hypothetical protein
VRVSELKGQTQCVDVQGTFCPKTTPTS